MRLLPSQAAQAITEAIEQFNSTGQLTIYEPCNCGGQIRHNDGGNYHEVIRLAHDNGQDFVMYDSTSGLEAPAEWEPVENALPLIATYADWL